jgi:multidrug efflux pump subunit AcrA (membrane-fusion protein)
MFVKVGFITGEAVRLMVPTRAIVQRSEVTAVYVIDAAGRISMRQVRLGDEIDGRTEILSGLAAGDHVALDPLAAARQMETAASGGQ